MPILFLAAFPVTFWLLRDQESSLVRRIFFTLSVLSILWAALSILQVMIRFRKMGFRRSNLTKLLMGPRPSDMNELLIWQWALQSCYAALVLVLCLVAVQFAP